MKMLGTCLLVLFLASPVYASPGGTNADGCHVCRTNCERYQLEQGEYHCHKKIAALSNPRKTMVKIDQKTNSPWLVATIAAVVLASALIFWRWTAPRKA